MSSPSKLNHTGNTGQFILLLDRTSLLQSTGHFHLLTIWNISAQLLLHSKRCVWGSRRDILSPRAGARLRHHAPPAPRCFSRLLLNPRGSTQSPSVGRGGPAERIRDRTTLRRGIWRGEAGTRAGELWPGRAAAALAVQGGKPSGLHSSQPGQAFQRSQAPTDFHFVFFKTDPVAVSLASTFSHFNLHPVQTLQTFSTGISQGQSFSL